MLPRGLPPKSFGKPHSVSCLDLQGDGGLLGSLRDLTGTGHTCNSRWGISAPSQTLGSTQVAACMFGAFHCLSPCWSHLAIGSLFLPLGGSMALAKALHNSLAPTTLAGRRAGWRPRGCQKAGGEGQNVLQWPLGSEEPLLVRRETCWAESHAPFSQKCPGRVPICPARLPSWVGRETGINGPLGKAGLADAK